MTIDNPYFWRVLLDRPAATIFDDSATLHQLLLAVSADQGTPYIEVLEKLHEAYRNAAPGNIRQLLEWAGADVRTLEQPDIASDSDSAELSPDQQSRLITRRRETGESYEDARWFVLSQAGSPTETADPSDSPDRQLDRRVRARMTQLGRDETTDYPRTLEEILAEDSDGHE